MWQTTFLAQYKGRCQKQAGGCLFLCGLRTRMSSPIFGGTWLRPPIFGGTWVHPDPPIFGWSSRVPPFQMNFSRPKIYIFQKVCIRFATFLYYPKRHDVIKFKILCYWISLIWITRSANKLIWMIKTLKLDDLRAQRDIFFGHGSHRPIFQSLSKFLVPPNTDDIFLHPPIPGQNFMDKMCCPNIFSKVGCPLPPKLRAPPPSGCFWHLP